MQPGHIRRFAPQLHRQVQQFQDEGSRLPLLPRHAPVRHRPALDFQCRTPDAPARVPADVPRDCRLDQAAPARLPRRPPHGTAAHRALPVPRHVGGTALHIPLRALAVYFQVGLRPQHRNALGSPRHHAGILRADPPGNRILPAFLHILRLPENPRQEGFQGAHVLRDALAVLGTGAAHHQLLPGIRVPGRRVRSPRALPRRPETQLDRDDPPSQGKRRTREPVPHLLQLPVRHRRSLPAVPRHLRRHKGLQVLPVDARVPFALPRADLHDSRERLGRL